MGESPLNHGLDQFMRNSSGGGSSGGAQKTADPTNEKETPQHVLDAGGRILATGAKLAGVPVNLSNLGEVSIFQPLGDGMEGLMDKKIPALFANVEGGVLARIAHSLVKNGVVSDQTGGVGNGEAVYTNESGQYAPNATPVAPASGGKGGDDFGVA